MFILYIHIFKIDRTKLLYIAISQVWECLGMFVISHDFPVFPSTSLNPRRKWQQTFRNMLHPVAICGPQGSRDERHEHG